VGMFFEILADLLQIACRRERPANTY